MSYRPAEHDATEASLHQDVQRSWVRRASAIVVAGQGAAFLIGGILPTTPDADRFGLLLGAALVALTGVAWFVLLPRHLFGEWRVFIAAAVAEVVIHVVLAVTGGVGSLYFPYVFMPILVMVMTGQSNQALIIGGLALLGLIMLAALDLRGPGDDAIVRDALAIRALEIVTFAAATSAIGRAMGAVMAALSARGTSLAASARTDPLTGLGNRRLLEDELRRMRSAADRSGLPLTVIAIDLDGMKDVNDRLGHAAGDRVLTDFARVLLACIRGKDVAIRSGGDEFVVLLPDTALAAAASVLERIRAGAGEVEAGWPLRLSAGLAAADREGDALKAADEAMYGDKISRRDRGERIERRVLDRT